MWFFQGRCQVWTDHFVDGIINVDAGTHRHLLEKIPFKVNGNMEITIGRSQLDFQDLGFAYCDLRTLRFTLKCTVPRHQPRVP